MCQFGIMRSDMYKVIIQRPRAGGGSKEAKGYWRGQQRIADDESPHREGMKKKWSSNRKYQTDLLGPLRRFLRSRLGQHWNKIYSELCEHVDKRNIVQAHLLDHVAWEVAKDVVIKDGEIVSFDWRTLWQEFYVCPKSGVLKSFKKKSRRKTSEKPSYYVVDAKRQYRCIDGLWYEVTLKPLPKPTSLSQDVILKRPAAYLNPYEAKQVYGDTVYASAKRQLNKREIKRMKIKFLITD